MHQKAFYRFLNLLIVFSMAVNTSLVVHAAGQPAAVLATSLTFHPIADAYVIKTYPNNNYGKALNLRVDSSPITRSYLRFTVSGLSGRTVQSASLRIYANSANTSLASRESGGTAPQLVITVSSASTSTPTSAPTKTPANTSTPTPTNTVAPSMTPTKTTLPTSSPTKTMSPTNTPTPTSPGGADWQPSFPIRAAFYYPWFPEAWTQKGIYPYTNYTPKLGYYSSTDQTILKQHIAMMQYGNIQAGIASWWGQGSQTDTKISGLLSAAAGTNFRWALYYENESQGDPTVSQIQNDLTYIFNHYGKDPSYLRVGGKFVVYVYADVNDTCGMADRWKQANTLGAYIVLKVFPGYSQCASQPNSWHQYSPAMAADQQGNYSYSISPGFWLKGQTVRLGRDLTRWGQNVRDMVASGANWQLVTTFSEWGEGTIVEPASEWASTSGFGQYLDVLHMNGK